MSKYLSVNRSMGKQNNNVSPCFQYMFKHVVPDYGSFFGEDPFSLIATWEGTNLDEFGSDSGVKERGSHSVATASVQCASSPQ